MPLIWFLYIGSRFCSALPSDPTLRRRPCASLSLHLHQVVKGTFTLKLSHMLGIPKKGAGVTPPLVTFVPCEQGPPWPASEIELEGKLHLPVAMFTQDAPHRVAAAASRTGVEYRGGNALTETGGVRW